MALPLEARRRHGNVHANAILDVLDRHLPSGVGLSVAEIGGAPGKYLAYLSINLGYKVTCIDYSAVGCQKTIDNFALLGIHGSVIQADLFSDQPELPAFDAVYSLGLIEHFADLPLIVGRHVRLVKPGGYLVLGVPNLRGIHGWFFRRLAPKTYATHEISAMDLDGWAVFESRLDLETVYKGYVGGFEPRIFCRLEEKTLPGRLLLILALGLRIATHTVFGFVRRFNGPHISGYAMAVYRTSIASKHSADGPDQDMGTPGGSLSRPAAIASPATAERTAIEFGRIQTGGHLPVRPRDEFRVRVLGSGQGDATIGHTP